MAGNGSASAKNVVLAKPLSVVGGVFVAPAGTSLPTDASTALASTYKTLGYITSDAVTRTVDRSVDNVYAWGGYLIAATLNEASCTVSFNCAEYLNEQAQALLYGEDNVTVTAAVTTEGSEAPRKMTISGKINDLPTECVLVIDVRGEDSVGRIIYPHFKVTELEDVQLAETEPTVVPIKGVAITDGTTGEAFIEYWEGGE